jgi:hypothetical protein
VFFLHRPEGEWNTNLGIKTLRTFNYSKRIIAKCGKPFFTDGFTIRASNSDNRVLKLFPVLLRDCLQGGNAVFNDVNVGLLPFGSLFSDGAMPS